MSTEIQIFFNELENNPKGELFGELQYRMVSANGFGLNPNEILSGQVQKPDKGTRLCLDYFGSISGKIEGNFHGTDYMNVLPAGNSTSNTHGMIVTSAGECISVKILGEVAAKGDVIYEIALRHNGESVNWVNSQYLFAKGSLDRVSGNTQLKVYAFDETPFGNQKSFYHGGRAFIDPDDSAVDYQNFPFALEQLENDAKATLIYRGEGRLNNIESYGVDVQAVFGGQVPIPEEGLRLTGFFSGPTQGSVNGVISGRNFLRLMPDGSMRMNSKIITRTLEGETLLLEALGANFPQTGAAWFETSQAVCNLDKFKHLTRLYNVGVGSTDVMSQQIVYNHYGYEANPFE